MWTCTRLVVYMLLAKKSHFWRKNHCLNAFFGKIWKKLDILELLHNRGGATHVKNFSENDPSRGKNIREIWIWHYKILRIQEINVKFWIPRTFLPQKRVIFRQKSYFRNFSLQYTIRIPWIKEALFHFENVKFGFPACFIPREVIFRKNFPSPYCVVAPTFFNNFQGLVPRE
jgi:hypothetical protein